MNENSYTFQPIGVIRSELATLEAAPLQGDEGAPEAWLELTALVAQGLAGITAGDELIVLTWLHRVRRRRREKRGCGVPMAWYEARSERGVEGVS